MSELAHFQESRFEVRWPRDLVEAELDRLLRRTPGRDFGGAWHDQTYWFLAEVFSDDIANEFTDVFARDTFKPRAEATQAYEWLDALRAALPEIPIESSPAPYWSSRKSAASQTQAKLTLFETSDAFAKIVDDLQCSGYLAEAFGEPCVDGDRPGKAGEIDRKIADVLGRDKLWPVTAHADEYSIDDLCDMIEFLHDHVSRPLVRVEHDFNDCGWHSEGYHRERGRQVYRWRIDTLLDRSDLGLTLSDDGRLETTSPEALEELIDSARATIGATHQSDKDQFVFAINSFRARSASLEQRKAAVVALAGILERRRDAIKAALKSDEGALFNIANNFGIRHQRADQQTDYDQDLYLEWIFYWYVATLHLTDRIEARAAAA